MGAHRSAGRIGLLAALWGVACTAPGPERQATLRLMEALAGEDSEGVLVGAVPPVVAGLLDLPAGDRVVGSVTAEAHTRVFVASGLRFDSVGVVYGRLLGTRGWRRWVPPGGLVRRGPVHEWLCDAEGRQLTLIYSRTTRTR